MGCCSDQGISGNCRLESVRLSDPFTRIQPVPDLALLE